MKKRFVIGSEGIPGWGGAATSAYSLFDMLQTIGFDCRFLNLLGPDAHKDCAAAIAETHGNPYSLPGVENCLLPATLPLQQAAIERTLNAFSPHLLIPVGSVAARLFMLAAPDIPMLFMTSGCRQLKEAMALGECADYLGHQLARDAGQAKPLIRARGEYEAVAHADLTVTHSPIIRRLYEFYFPEQRQKLHSKIVWFAEWIRWETAQYEGSARPWQDRQIELLFIASDWSRPEKGHKMLQDIVSLCSARFAVHIVGKVDSTLLGPSYHGSVYDRNELFQLLGNAKVVVCPSTFDAAPGVLFEAAAMGCNIVASANCGNWELCHEHLRVKEYTARAFVEKSELALTAKFADNMRQFEETRSFDELVRLISRWIPI